MVTKKKSSYYVQCIHLLGARFNPINHCKVFTSENMTPDVHPKPSRGFEWKEMTFYTNEEDFLGKAYVEVHFIKLNVTHTGSVWDTSYRPHHCFLCEPTYSTCSVLMCVIVGWYTADLSSAMTHLNSPEKKNKKHFITFEELHSPTFRSLTITSARRVLPVCADADGT